MTLMNGFTLVNIISIFRFKTIKRKKDRHICQQWSSIWLSNHLPDTIHSVISLIDTWTMFDMRKAHLLIGTSYLTFIASNVNHSKETRLMINVDLNVDLGFIILVFFPKWRHSYLIGWIGRIGQNHWRMYFVEFI